MIQIYGHDFCNKCKEAKRLAENKGLDHEYIDILENIEAKEDLDKRGIMDLPYIIKDNEIISLDELRKL